MVSRASTRPPRTRRGPKIEAVEAHLVHDWCIVRIHCSGGISGVGQATYFAAPSTTAAIVTAFTPSLLGQSALAIEHHWQHLHRSTSFKGSAKASAIAAIDIALWDVVGKFLEVPCYQLIGGRYRHKIRLYMHLGRGTTEVIVQRAREAMRDGYSAVKLDPVPSDFLDLTSAELSVAIVGQVAAVREVLGHGADLAVDFHNRLTMAQAVIVVGRLSEHRVLFLEDPIASDSIAAQADVARRVSLPLALGERLTTISEFGDLLRTGAADVIRPDVGLAGGLSACRKVAALAEAQSVDLAPHHTGSPIALAATLQLDAAIPNFCIQSYLNDHLSPMSGVLKQAPIPEGGYLPVPETPGLGIELDDVYLSQHGQQEFVNTAPIGGDGSVGYA